MFITKKKHEKMYITKKKHEKLLEEALKAQTDIYNKENARKADIIFRVMGTLYKAQMDHKLSEKYKDNSAMSHILFLILDLFPSNVDSLQEGEYKDYLKRTYQ